MKILQINAVNGIKSTGRTTLEASEYYKELGYDSKIAYSVGTHEKNNYIIGNELDRKSHGLLSRVSGKQGYFSKKETRKLLDFINKFNPDIVHLRNLHSNYINLNLLLKYLGENDIATVITLHDCWFYTGKCTHYTLDNCNKWENGCYNCPRLKKDNPSWFFDRTPEMYSDKKHLYENIPRLAVVGVSNWITEEAKKSILSNSLIITRIYNWVDLNVFKPRNIESLKKELNLTNKFVLLGVASFWSMSKGIDKFLELSKKISEDTSILLVGKVPSGTIFPENIVHIEETNNTEELAQLYSLADVLINFSLEETFGKVTAEAIACGTPAIAINSTANPELVGPGCGYVINDDNIDSIMNSLEKVKIRGKQAFSNECINYARINFSKNDRLSEYIDVYEELISAEGAS